MSDRLKCFKAYDIRGRVPDELNSDIARRIGCAVAEYLSPRRVVVGHDIRLSSPEITNALVEGFLSSGVDVIHLGRVGTEEIYFATSDLGVEAGVIVTASHNPKDYNGMKIVRESSIPVSGDSGLDDIREIAERGNFKASATRGELTHINHRGAYAENLLTYVDVATLKPLKIVVNAGNGGAGEVIDVLESRLPFEFIKVHHEPDGSFPHGVPNPILPENRPATISKINECNADLGIAWDGDFDRCFLFDESGRFIEGYYIVGLLAEAFLKRHPGAKIVHDPRLTWNTIDVAAQYGGVPVCSKTGHAFIKERMRLEDAVYGGEMSAHHYFRDFAYCDSGMIPWLLVSELMSQQNATLSSLINQRMAKFPASGEINNRIENPPAVLAGIEAYFRDSCLSIDYTDGLSMEFKDWRFNVRMSNTEPVVRLNVESRGLPELMQQKTDEILGLMARL